MRRNLAILLAWAGIAGAHAAQELVALETRRDANDRPVQTSYAIDHPAAPVKAVLLILAGGNGDTGLARRDGQVAHNQRRNPVVIALPELAARGYAVALFGLPADQPKGYGMAFRRHPDHWSDIASVAADAARRFGGVRVYLVGLGSGAISAFHAARERTPRFAGIIAIGASVGAMRTFDFAQLNTPALVLYGARGRCDSIAFVELQEIAQAHRIALLPVAAPAESPDRDPCALGSAAFLAGREREAAVAFADWAEGRPLPDLMDGRALEPPLNERVMFITQPRAPGAPKLETTVYKPDGEGPFPLLVVNHGIPADRVEMRQEQRRLRWMRQAETFVKHGFVVAIPMRRGFGRSGGIDNRTSSLHVADFGLEDALDIEAVVEALGREPYVDPLRVVALGQSGGGLAALALASRNPPYLKAVINFAGGLRSQRRADWEDNLLRGIGKLGPSSVPSVWIYNENDSYFAPGLVKQMHQAYLRAGGNAVLYQNGPFGRDGHDMWATATAVPLWWPVVEKFLAQQGLLQ